MIEIARTGRVLQVALNRPEKRNALSAELCNALVTAFDEADADGEVGAILVKGNGPAFCAGMDLQEARETGSEHLAGIHERLFTTIQRTRKPIIAAVRGPAIAGGTGLAANAHIVVAAPGARFGLTEIRIGLWPVLIFRACVLAMGERRTTELSLTGRIFSAAEALSHGLVTEIAEDPLARAMEIAVKVSEYSPFAMRGGLDYVQRIRRLDWEEAGKAGRQLRGQLMNHEDFAKGVQGFLGKDKRDSQVSNLFQETCRVRFFDVEPGGRASVPAICRFLEEAANSQTERLGFSIRQVREADRMWVLTRFALNVFASPRIGDEISIETWASDRTAGVRAYRDFRLRDAAGGILVEAASLWLLLDLRTRRPVRLPDAVLRIRDPECVGMETVDSSPLIAPETVTSEDEFKIRWSDLDENGHANNIRYIEWVLETVPVAVRQGAGLSSLDIQFVNEGLPGESVIAAAEATADGFRHRLTAGDGRVLGIARTTWRYEAMPSSSSGSPDSP